MSIWAPRKSKDDPYRETRPRGKADTPRATTAEWGFVSFGVFVGLIVAEGAYLFGFESYTENGYFVFLVLALFLMRRGGRIPDYRAQRRAAKKTADDTDMSE